MRRTADPIQSRPRKRRRSRAPVPASVLYNDLPPRARAAYRGWSNERFQASLARDIDRLPYELGRHIRDFNRRPNWFTEDAYFDQEFY